MAGDGGPPGLVGDGTAAMAGHAPVADPPELRLTGEQIGLLRREGEVRRVAAGEVLFREGDRGYVVTGPALGPDTRHLSPWTGRQGDPYLLETSAPGVFASGDVRSGSVKRAAAAVGEGSIAVRFVSEYLGHRAGFAAPAAGG